MRVQAATQAWGIFQTPAGAVVAGRAFTLSNLDGTPASLYTTATGTVLVTSLVTGSNGQIPGYVEAGAYTLTVGADNYRVEAISSQTSAAPKQQIALGVSTSSSPTATEIDAFNALISPRQVDMVLLFGSYENTTWASPLATLASKNITPVITLESATLPANAILNGSWDTQLIACATAFKNFGRTLIARPWHEFNLGGTQNPYGHGTKGGSAGDTTAQLIAAWHYIHDLMVAQGVTNVLWFWCPNAFGSPADVLDPRPYYPGNDYVDIIGTDAYTSVGSSLSEQTLLSVLDDNFGQPNYTLLTQMAPDKPFLIGEMGVASGAPNGAATIDKRQWFRDADKTIRARPAIAGICYWNRDSGGGNDYTIDTTGTNLGARNAFRDMVNGPPFTSLARNQTGRKQVTVVPYASTLTVDVGQGDTFFSTLTGNVTIGAPTGTPVNGQRVAFRLKQDATGSRTVAWNSIFRFSTDLPSPTASTGANKLDYVVFEYNAADTKYDCVQIIKGF